MAFTGRVNKGKALTESELDNNFVCHYPVGSLYLACSPQTDSPGALIGYGYWTKFAKGRALISSTDGVVDVSNTPSVYYSPTMIGGSPSHTLTVGEMPGHIHSWPDQVEANGETTSGKKRWSGNYADWCTDEGGRNCFRTSRGGNTIDLVNSPILATYTDVLPHGSGVNKIVRNYVTKPGQPHNNIQPYTVINIWKRES